MAKVILVLVDAKPSTQLQSPIRWFGPESDSTIIISTDSETERRQELIRHLESGDTVIAHRSIKNSDGVAVGGQCVSLECTCNLHEVLHNRLTKEGAPSVFDVVKKLAEDVNKLRQT